VETTDYYKSSKALELTAEALPAETPELALIEAIRNEPIRTWVFQKQVALSLIAKSERILIPSDLWWTLGGDLTRGHLGNQSVLKVDLTASIAHLYLPADGRGEYHSCVLHRGELQIHKAGFIQWLNSLEQTAKDSHVNLTEQTGPERYARWAVDMNRLRDSGEAKTLRAAAKMVAGQEGVDVSYVLREERRIRKEREEIRGNKLVSRS